MSPNRQLTSIGSGNGLAPNKWEAIVWANDNPVHWRICAALGGGGEFKVYLSEPYLYICHELRMAFKWLAGNGLLHIHWLSSHFSKPISQPIQCRSCVISTEKWAQLTMTEVIPVPSVFIIANTIGRWHDRQAISNGTWVAGDAPKKVINCCVGRDPWLLYLHAFCRCKDGHS